MNRNHHIPPKATPPLSDVARAKQLFKDSEEARIETKRMLEECNKTLEKTQRFSDQALINQRKLIFALNSLLPRPIRFTVSFSLDEDKFTAKLAEETAAVIGKRKVFDIVQAINVLAMANTDVIDIFIDYSGNENSFAVLVNPNGKVYKTSNLESLGQVVLSDENALEKLLSIESQLTELIIEAREEAEANAEVEA